VVCLIPMMTSDAGELTDSKVVKNVIDSCGKEMSRKGRIAFENLWIQRPVLVTWITVSLCALGCDSDSRCLFRLRPSDICKGAGLPAVEFKKNLSQLLINTVLFALGIATNQEKRRA